MPSVHSATLKDASPAGHGGKVMPAAVSACDVVDEWCRRVGALRVHAPAHREGRLDSRDVVAEVEQELNVVDPEIRRAVVLPPDHLMLFRFLRRGGHGAQ